jgi:putative flippase GtrA
MYPAMALQVAALFGVAAGLVFNFIINRYWVFKARAQ